MSRRTVAVETMEIGKKGRGKHWTAAEVAARQDAADMLKREKAARLKPPEWLSKDARSVWQEKLKHVAGLKAANELLDVLDTEMLAVFCDAYVQYRDLAQKSKKEPDDIKDLQAWSRIIGNYAAKLGVNPSARARLVKKRADEKKDQFGSKFD